jgi:hypothetical protein
MKLISWVVTATRKMERLLRQLAPALVKRLAKVAIVEPK